METLELKKLLNEIGNSVHSMNTIAAALSIMPDDTAEAPKGLDISWKPKDLEKSKNRSRNFAGKSTYVYVAENLFEYLNNISQNSLWKYPEINFSGDEKKAIKVYNFLHQIPETTDEMNILCELLCHWRNRIVHANSSKANLSSKKRQLLISKREYFLEKFHHFDPSLALDNFDNKHITLKDVSTLTTIVIKCCRAVDNHFFNGINQIQDFKEYKLMMLTNQDFQTICKQSPSNKRTRQIEKWIRLNYSYLETDKLNKMMEIFGDK